MHVGTFIHFSTNLQSYMTIKWMDTSVDSYVAHDLNK